MIKRCTFTQADIRKLHPEEIREQLTRNGFEFGSLGIPKGSVRLYNDYHIGTYTYVQTLDG